MTIFGKDHFRARTIEFAVFSLPGFLDIFDHTGIGEHNTGPDPL
jgi:hypothetical protein